MRALDCPDATTHGDLHVVGTDDADLVRQVREHIEDAHPNLSPDQAEAIVAQGAYDE